MNIGLDASRANLAQKTGTEWYSFRLINEFGRLTDGSDQFYLYTKEKLRPEFDPLPANFKPVVLRWPPKYLWTQLRLSLHLLFRPPDVLFVPAHTLPLVHGKKTVLTVHDVGFERFHQLYSTKRIGPKRGLMKLLLTGVRLATGGKYGPNELDYHRWAMNYALKHANCIICPSHFTRKEILEIYQVEPKRIRVIPHGIDSETYRVVSRKSEQAKTLRKYHISPPFFLYVGRLERKKNTVGLIRGFAKFKRATGHIHKLVLAGNPGYGYDEIRNEILHQDIARELVLPGFLEQPDLVNLLNAADAFIFPSFYEGFGLPILEAMACGAPVVASEAASIPEVAGTSALLFDPYQPEELSAQLKAIAANESLRNDLRMKGFNNIKKYSWRNCATETLECLHELAEET